MQHLGYYVRKGEVAMVALKTTYEEPVSADAHEEHRERAREEILAILEQIQEDIRDEN